MRHAASHPEGVKPSWPFASSSGLASFAAGTRPWSETDEFGQEGDDAAAASNALLAASIGSGVAGAVVIAVTAATGKGQPAVGAALVPLPTGGMAFQLGGRW